MTRCASCGRLLTPDEATYLDGRFCERCDLSQRHPVPAEFDPLADTWASIIEARRVIHELGERRG